MLLDVATQMQQLVRRRTQLDADRPFLELLDKLRVLDQREAVAYPFGVEKDGVVEIGVAWVARAACVEQGFAGVEHERYVDVQGLAGLYEGEQLVAVEAD